jgi:hypothetical protein
MRLDVTLVRVTIGTVTPQNFKFWDVTKIYKILKNRNRLKFAFRSI